MGVVRDRIRTSWHWIGLAVGAAMGLADYGVFVLMGRPELVPPRPAFFATGLAIVFGALGFAVGRLALARQRARRDADTIAQQLAKLEETQRALVEHEKLAAIGRIAAGVAHEVRNPLGVIRASAAMLREHFEAGTDPERACRFVCEECDRLNGLITALLGFARPTTPRLETVEIAGILERALALAEPALRARGARVETSAVRGTVRLDPDLVAQAVFDLLTNAAEAIDEGGRVALRVALDATALRVEVADDGAGVPTAQREQLFEPFVTSKPRGTGLGLAMALRIAQAHGGTLDLLDGAGQGVRGAGACFRLTLPNRTASAARAVA